jgi:hypothetical protein
MPHLNLEELARLVDEAPTEDEALHLSGCSECRRELDELEGQVRATAEMPELSAPAGEWEAIRARLAGERVLAGRSPGLLGPAGTWRGALLRMAAALALFVSGGLTSELLRGASGSGAQERIAVAEPTTAEEAERALIATEAEYVAALSRYSELAGTDVSEDPLNRLAALEGIVLTTRAALRDAPGDPVINGYHLTALTQREAMLRQISRTTGDGWF